MNREELIHAIAKQAGVSKKAAEATLSAFLAVVQETVRAGERVQLLGFGSFEQRERAERKSINPRTREPITVPARKVAVFKPGKGFEQIAKK